jgi:hypothetical protein
MNTMKNILPYIIASLIFLPFVAADTYMPALMNIYGLIGIILLIPIVLVESIVTYFVLKYNKIDLKFGYDALMVACANIVSTIIGFILSFLILWGSKDPRATIIMLYPAFILSAFTEFPIIGLFLRKKCKNPWIKSLQLSFLINFVSYTLILILLVLSTLF